MRRPETNVRRRQFLAAVAAGTALTGTARGERATGSGDAGVVGYGSSGYGDGGFGAAVLEPIGSANASPADPDGDGLYEDVNGDGVVDVADALHYYDNRRGAVVRTVPEQFDFDGDGTAGTVADALALYQRYVR